MSGTMRDIRTSLAGQAIVGVFEVEATGLFGRRQQTKEMQTFIDCPETETYFCRRSVDGESQIQRVFSVREVDRLGPSDFLVQVNTRPLAVEIGYAGLISSEGTVFLDLAIAATVKISEPRRFLTECGLNWVKMVDVVDVTRLETLLGNQCKQPVTDEVLTATYDDLKLRERLPVSWWENKLRQWLALDWLELVDITAVQYASATEDKAREMEKRQKLMDLELEGQERMHQRDIQLQQDQLAYEQDKAQLEANHELSGLEREEKLAEAKLRFEKALMEAREENELVRFQTQKQRAEWEAEIDRIRSREDLAAERLEQAKQSEKRSREMLERYETAKAELDSSIGLLKDAIRAGVADAKRVSEHAGRVSSETMELLGRPQGSAYLAQVFREKVRRAVHPVMMKKVELRTRDIGVQKVDTLSINSDLQFEFMVNQKGYVTLLNIGTSGKIWLHGPNAYVGIEASRVEAGRRYAVPGPELLPYERLAQQGLGYVEIGPPGWEELIVIVTDQPIISAQDVFSSTVNNPFAELSPKRVTQLVDLLADLDEDAWTCGFLGFLVE